MSSKQGMGSNGRTFRLLGVSGSGRKRSYNSSLIRAAMEILPQGLSLENYDVSGFPLFNEDIEAKLPTDVKEFKEKIRGVDGVLFATPEYNYSISAVLKNALEWGNRPDNSWEGRPAAIMSASVSPRGGARAQLHLRQILVDLDMYPLNQPQLLVANADEKFDDNLRLTDQRSRQTLREMLLALAQWGRKLKPRVADDPTATSKTQSNDIRLVSQRVAAITRLTVSSAKG